MISVIIIFSLVTTIFYILLTMIKKREMDNVIFIAFLGFIVVTWLTTDYYLHRVVFPNNVIAVNNTLQRTKGLIDPEDDLNIEDTQMHKRISELIYEQEINVADYKNSKRNLFVIFKPTMPDEMDAVRVHKFVTPEGDTIHHLYR